MKEQHQVQTGRHYKVTSSDRKLSGQIRRVVKLHPSGKVAWLEHAGDEKPMTVYTHVANLAVDLYSMVKDQELEQYFAKKQRLQEKAEDATLSL